MESLIKSNVGRKGEIHLIVKCENPENVKHSASRMAIYRNGEKLFLSSFRKAMKGDEIHLWHNNAYVNTGLNNSLDREFGLGGTAIGFIGVSSNTTAVTATTVFLNGASGGAAANTIIKAISPAASRVAQTTTGGATFVNADFTSGVFAWAKIGYLTTSTDAGTGLVDVIGGTGGTSPYNRTFALDLTSAGAFSVTAQLAITAVAV